MKKTACKQLQRVLYISSGKFIASFPTAIGSENLKVNSMNSFIALSISQFRDLILVSSNGTSPSDIIPTHLDKSFADYCFLDLLELLYLSLSVGCFPPSFKMAFVRPQLKAKLNINYISKLLERAVFMQLSEQLEKKGLFSNKQSAKFFLVKVKNDLVLK